MDDSIESNETSSECNVSNNDLTRYMMLNKELSKSLAILRAENVRLRDKNKELNFESLTYRNELANNQEELMQWRRKITKLQAMYIQHVETVSKELRSYAEKLTGVLSNDDENVEAEVTGRDDRENPTPSTPRASESSKLSKLPHIIDENPFNLTPVTEESGDDLEANNSQQISLVISTPESTLNDETGMATATKTIDSPISVFASCEMTSMGSNKENERPSSSILTITNGNTLTASKNSSAILRTNETVVPTIIKPVTLLKEKLIALRLRTQKRKNERNSLKDTSTPYKRKKSGRHSDKPGKSNDSTRMNSTLSMSVSASGRPKRSVCPVNFVEPKLNTKMRRS